MNRFDIIEAYYLFFTHYHEGQNSRKYTRLSKILTYYKPPINLTEESLTNGARIIYDELVDLEVTTDAGIRYNK